MPNATQGRNGGGRPKRQTATPMTSTSVQPAAASRRRTEEAAPKETPLELPTLYLDPNRKQNDVYDTGLEDAQWHYLWVNKTDTMSLSGYYASGYRFVKYADVKERFKEDQRSAFLYEEDVNGWVAYGPTDRLMRIPQEVFRADTQAALNGQEVSAVEKARQLLNAQIEEGKYAGTIHKSATLSVDDDSGSTETTTLVDQGGTE